jgi:hypothetical protein
MALLINKSFVSEIFPVINLKNKDLCDNEDIEFLSKIINDIVVIDFSNTIYDVEVRDYDKKNKQLILVISLRVSYHEPGTLILFLDIDLDKVYSIIPNKGFSENYKPFFVMFIKDKNIENIEKIIDKNYIINNLSLEDFIALKQTIKKFCKII